jgi:3-phenylpropionate/trans-cinnamate dioxygenase ferredoxin reductase subunit
MTVVIAGAGLAGARTAETLRADGYDGRIVLVGDEPKAPYERPALSKQFLAGARGARDIELRPRTYWAEQEIELVTGTRVESVDFDRRVAVIGDAAVPWNAFVLATGARPRRLPGPPGVHHLRTFADAEALASALEAGAEVVIVGAGFVGAEVASTARSLGAEVTLVDAAPLPFAHVFGEDVGRLLANRYVSSGVRLHLGAGVRGFRAGADGRLAAVQLSDGTEVDAHVAVVGIGVEPATELLTPGAVETDASGRTHRSDVYACGDVAAWWRPTLGAHRRVEHWTSAAGQARAVARSILGWPETYDEPPYFWSDQFGLRLQYVGHAKDWTIVELEGDERSFVARYLRQDGADAAALAVNRPREVAALRRALAA